MKKNVEIGDLLKSNPLKGYWVCSIVLSYQPKSDDLNAMSHVATTNAIFEHDFSLSEIDRDKLEIIYSKNNEGNVVPCIEIHAAKLAKDIDVIGQLEAESYYPHPLQFQIGNGSDGGWPQCGPLKKSLGFQAVHKWRAVNDREAWLNDIAAAEKSHTEMLERLKNV
jgi:hypothetical protein